MEREWEGKWRSLTCEWILNIYWINWGYKGHTYTYIYIYLYSLILIVTLLSEKCCIKCICIVNAVSCFCCVSVCARCLCFELRRLVHIPDVSAPHVVASKQRAALWEVLHKLSWAELNPHMSHLSAPVRDTGFILQCLFSGINRGAGFHSDRCGGSVNVPMEFLAWGRGRLGEAWRNKWF